jgi:hypothetical protein
MVAVRAEFFLLVLCKCSRNERVVVGDAVGRLRQLRRRRAGKVVDNIALPPSLTQNAAPAESMKAVPPW